ncbi:MAG: hypothetical protein HY298_09780 [Verrucomicrobia bacterium]|nr:hypothetical protein [Verrucomicrobiota bacterium]
MKTTITLKEFSALSSGTVQVKHATAPAIPESSAQPTPESIQGFHVPTDGSDTSIHELLHRRYTAPFVSAIPYHRWGLNE